MAPASSSLRRQSHPFFSNGPFDITAALSPILGNNSNYGQFPYLSSIFCQAEGSPDEVAVKVKMMGYNSPATALLQDKVYFLGGRIIAVNVRTPPVFYYEQQTTFLIADSENYPHSFANKTSCWGFGIVISKEEYTVAGTAGNSYKNLAVKVKHTDYDNLARDSVSFFVDYIIPGNRNLGKTFGLFQPGREILIAGYISGYNGNSFTFQVTAMSVSVASGNEVINPPVAAKVSTSVWASRRAVQIDFDVPDDSQSPAPAKHVDQEPNDDDESNAQQRIPSLNDTTQQSIGKVTLKKRARTVANS